MISILNWLKGANSRPSAFESKLLDCVRSHVGPSLRERWDRQVQAINKVQRLPGGVEVDFYRMHRGRPTFDEGMAFPNKTKELRLARLVIALNDVSLNASIWCVNGFLFSIEYSSSPAYFEEADGMDPPSGYTIACDMAADLMTPVPLQA